MTEIHKDKVTAEEWQKALDGLEVGDEYENEYERYRVKEVYNDSVFDDDGGLDSKRDITAIRKAPQSEEQADTANEAIIGIQLSDQETDNLIDEVDKVQNECEDKAEQPKDLDGILAERGARYGSFASQAEFSQYLKDTLRRHNDYDKLMYSQKEALEMIMHKISRILNGDPNYDDSWRDIAGYAELIVKELNENTIKG